MKVNTLVQEIAVIHDQIELNDRSVFELIRIGIGDGQSQLKLSRARFLLVFWDEQQQEWTVITDRLGAYHAYAVWRDGKIAAIGDDLVQLARTESKRELDWEGLATFLAFGFFLDDRTYYQDIRVLQPASVYRIARDGHLISHRRYWEWHHTVDESRSYDDTVEQYDALLKQAVGRCMDGRPILPISGGLDSRSLAYAMPDGPETQSYSYGYTPDSVETRIAAQIAASRGFTFDSHVIQPYLFARLPEITQILHGCQDVTQARQMSLNGWVSERADAVLTGLWGDVWCDQMGLADGLPAGVAIVDQILRRFKKRGSDWLWDHVVVPSFPQHDTASGYLSGRIQEHLSNFEFEDVDFQVKAYKTSQWAFRWSNASLRGFEPGGSPRIPYYDVDLIDFFCTVPTDFVRDRRLQIDHLRRFAPDLASITWQATGTNLFRVQHRKWLPLPGRAYRKAKRLLLRQRPIQRNWEVQFLSEQGRQNLECWLLQPGRKVHDLVSPQELRSLVEEFYRVPDAANGYTVSMLLTLSAWLESVE